MATGEECKVSLGRALQAGEAAFESGFCHSSCGTLGNWPNLSDSKFRTMMPASHWVKGDKAKAPETVPGASK